jgi:putative Holliday junction resolvase
MPATPEAADRVLGFDYGERRIGMAFGQRVTGTAQALAVVGNGAAGPAWPLIDQALREWRPDALVVGLPLTLDGNEQPIARSARRFAGALATRYGLPVHHHDERLTSVEAGARFVAARRSGTRRAKHAAALDAMAAQVIVESFLAATLRPRAGAAS